MPRVLFIEDDANICQALQVAAERSFWALEFISSNDLKRGRAADFATTGKRFDAIVVAGYFLDAEVQYGHHIVEQLRKRRCRAIIVGTSGDPKREADFLTAGADAFVCRGSSPLKNPAGGFTKAAELYAQATAKRASSKKKSEPKPTPDHL